MFYVLRLPLKHEIIFIVLSLTQAWRERGREDGEQRRENGVPAYRRTGVPQYRCTSVPAYRRAGVPAYWRASVPAYGRQMPLIVGPKQAASAAANRWRQAGGFSGRWSLGPSRQRQRPLVVGPKQAASAAAGRWPQAGGVSGRWRNVTAGDLSSLAPSRRRQRPPGGTRSARQRATVVQTIGVCPAVVFRKSGRRLCLFPRRVWFVMCVCVGLLLVNRGWPRGFVRQINPD